ncbi:ABC transporter substrate-binding protein, partial [Chloroflexota bacterium]
IEKPRYGGFHVTASPVDYSGLLDDISQKERNWWLGPVQDELIIPDWTLGLRGTEDWSGVSGVVQTMGIEFGAGLTAEGWTIPDDETIIWHIRPGIHYALNPASEASKMVGGRELTAEDVAYCYRMQWTIGYPSKQYPFLKDHENLENSIYVDPDDRWSVVVKTLPGQNGQIWEINSSARYRPFSSPEVVEKYGTAHKITDAVGTGPFILTDYIGGSAVTYDRNPNYWMNDPFFPENQLPYIDGFRVLIIPDASTQVAALRTGRIDNLPSIGTGVKTDIAPMQAVGLMESSPELEWSKYLGDGGKISMRNDTEPFDDVRVRQALHMAVDHPSIKDLYYGGEAELLNHPIVAAPETARYFIPLEETSDLVQELYGYHPDKARQLLAEAGYPDGFKTNIIARPGDVEVLSIVKDNFEKIGVDMEIQVKDVTVHTTIGKKKTHTQMYINNGGNMPMIWSSRDRIGGGGNYNMNDDPWHKVIWNRMTVGYFDPDNSKNMTEPMDAGMPNYVNYMNEQAFDIYLPQPYTYTFWQPWLKDYNGVGLIAYAHGYGWTRYVWIDQELKEAMGH